VAGDSTLLRQLSTPDQYRAQFCYENSPICVPDGTKPPEGTARIAPSARPGTRAPHCWIGKNRSMLDLFGNGFVLVRFGSPDEAERDIDPLITAAAERGFPLEIANIDHSEAAAIYEKPLVLVRPDGHIAWRGDALPDDAGALLDHVRGA
jgi:hypothetical protein